MQNNMGHTRTKWLATVTQRMDGEQASDGLSSCVLKTTLRLKLSAGCPKALVRRLGRCLFPNPSVVAA